MLKSIIQYPDPILRTKCTLIPDRSEWFDIWKDLHETCQFNNGLGLSAPQIGLPYRMFVLENGTLIVDPIIQKFSSTTNVEIERCLSLPSIEAIIERSTQISVNYFSLTNSKLIVKLTGLQARVFQHEYDHLNGILIIDKSRK